MKAVVASNKALAKIIEEQGRSCERLLNTVNDLFARYREGMKLSRRKEPGLLMAQKRALFTAVVTGSLLVAYDGICGGSGLQLMRCCVISIT